MSQLIDQLRQIAVVNGLRRSSLLADCPHPVLETISTFTSVRSLETGDVLFDEQTPVREFFIVQAGAIKLHRVTSWGRPHVIHVFRPPELLGEEMLVSEVGYAATASATEPSQVLTVSRSGFLALLRRYPELTLNVLRSLSAQVELLVGRIDELTLKDVPTRLADWLLRHCPHPDSHQPQTVLVGETKRLLASELGISSETLSRALAKFRDRHLLRVDGRAVTLFCPARLAQSVHAEDPAPPTRSRPVSGLRTSAPAFTTTATCRRPIPLGRSLRPSSRPGPGRKVLAKRSPAD